MPGNVCSRQKIALVQPQARNKRCHISSSFTSQLDKILHAPKYFSKSFRYRTPNKEHCALRRSSSTHKLGLRALHGYYESTFEKLLDKDKSMTTHKRNLQTVMVQIYKTINHLSPGYMWEFFTKKDIPCNLRSNELCKSLP